LITISTERVKKPAQQKKTLQLMPVPGWARTIVAWVAKRRLARVGI